MTYMLVSVSFCWVILSAPLNIHTILALNGIRMPSIDDSRLLKTICFCLLYLNHSINLLLYCFTGRKFRLELKVSFLTHRCLLLPRNRRTIGPIYNKTGNVYQWTANHSCVCTKLGSCDLDLDPVTLIIDLDLDVMTTYMCIKNDVSRLWLSEVRAFVKCPRNGCDGVT